MSVSHKNSHVEAKWALWMDELLNGMFEWSELFNFYRVYFRRRRSHLEWITTRNFGWLFQFWEVVGLSLNALSGSDEKQGCIIFVYYLTKATEMEVRTVWINFTPLLMFSASFTIRWNELIGLRIYVFSSHHPFLKCCLFTDLKIEWKYWQEKHWPLVVLLNSSSRELGNGNRHENCIPFQLFTHIRV